MSSDRMIMHRLLIASLVVATCAWPLVARAQPALCINNISGEQFVGCVNNILEKRWLFFDKTVDASERVEIRRPTADAFRVLRPVEANEPVGHLDLLRLDKSVDLELYLSHSGSLSRVVLARGGVWEISRDSLPRLTITHGQMVVDQLQGRLEAYLENVLNVIHATTVYYDVDSTAGVSRVFLKEGHMSFPEYDIDVQGSDSLWILRRGMPPEPVPATPEMIRRWREREEHSRVRIWDRAATPIVLRPKFWLLAGGLAAGAVLLDCTLTHVVCGGSEEYRIPNQ